MVLAEQIAEQGRNITSPESSLKTCDCEIEGGLVAPAGTTLCPQVDAAFLRHYIEYAHHWQGRQLGGLRLGEGLQEEDLRLTLTEILEPTGFNEVVLAACEIDDPVELLRQFYPQDFPVEQKSELETPVAIATSDHNGVTPADKKPDSPVPEIKKAGLLTISDDSRLALAVVLLRLFNITSGNAVKGANVYIYELGGQFPSNFAQTLGEIMHRVRDRRQIKTLEADDFREWFKDLLRQIPDYAVDAGEFLAQNPAKDTKFILKSLHLERFDGQPEVLKKYLKELFDGYLAAYSASA